MPYAHIRMAIILTWKKKEELPRQTRQLISRVSLDSIARALWCRAKILWTDAFVTAKFCTAIRIGGIGRWLKYAIIVISSFCKKLLAEVNP